MWIPPGVSVGAGYWSVVLRAARQMEQVMFDREIKEELIMAKQIRQGTAVIKSRKSLRVGSFMISRKLEASLDLRHFTKFHLCPLKITCLSDHKI